METKLIITIDVEEKGEIWNSEYSHKYPNINYLNRINKIQSLFNKYDVKPTYLLNFPVLKDKKVVEIFKDIEVRGECELGTHIHVWNTPPFEEENSVENTFLCNLNKKLIKKKLISIFNKFNNQIRHNPFSHKSGRYGLGSEELKILREIGYKVDTSVLPFKKFIKGSDFRDFPTNPYFPSMKNIKKKGHQKDILEIPITSRFTRKNEKKWQKLYNFIKYNIPNFHIIGVMEKLNICRKITLNPESFDFKNMRKISDSLIKRKEPVLHMMFHSSNIVVGGTPYVKNKKMYKEFFENLERILNYLVNKKNIKSMTCEEFYYWFKGNQNEKSN